LIANQEQLLEEGDRLDKLRRSYDGDDAVDESYVVLTIGASLIATLGLLANNAAVVIGAMVVAPWILPLRALVFGSLIGDRKLLLRAVAHPFYRRDNYHVVVDGARPGRRKHESIKGCSRRNHSSPATQSSGSRHCSRRWEPSPLTPR